MDKYVEKQKYFESRFVKTAAAAFYRDVFPEGSFEESVGYHDNYLHTNKGNGFIVYQTDDKKMHTRMVFDDLEEIQKYLNAGTAFMSPISYFGKNRTAANARELFALVFDLDEVGQRQIKDLFQGWLDCGRLPMPTYIVNSGGGVHLYYVFDQPVPMYPNIQKQLKNLKYELVDKIWNSDTSELQTKQYQGINQGFRLVGSRTKRNEEVTAYRVGSRVTLEYLSLFVEPENRITDTFYHPKMTLEQAKEKYPDWYEQRIVHHRKKKNWTCKRDLYDWWKRNIRQVKVHHRYFYVMCLTVYAVKCGILFEELQKDVLGMREFLNDIAPDNPFTEYDVESALEMYQECYRSFPRDEIAKLSGIEIKPNKRNGRTRVANLKIARFIRDMNQEEKGTKWNGRKSYREGVFKFIDCNPTASYRDFCELTDMSKRVFYKYKKEWTAIQTEKLLHAQKRFAIASIFDNCVKDAETGEPVNLAEMISGIPAPKRPPKELWEV